MVTEIGPDDTPVTIDCADDELTDLVRKGYTFTGTRSCEHSSETVRKAVKYFLDAEFNGFGGQLIALALVPEEAGAASFYEVLPCHEPVQWVVEHVLPVLQRAAIPRDEVIGRLAAYLRDDAEPVVVASWPEDIANLALLMITGPGWRMPSPRLIFELLDLPLFDSEFLSEVPHNARSDAVALRDYVLAQGLNAAV